jgi:hypothetical protein
MQHIQHQTLTWIRTTRTPPRVGGHEPVEPLALPDRERIHRVAAIHHAQLVAVQRDATAAAEVSRQQLEALREFMRELTPADANVFMDLYTEESSAVERAWAARQRAWRPSTAVSPTLVRVLVFVVTVVSIGLALYYAV